MIIVAIWWHMKMNGDAKDPWAHGFSIKAFQELKSIIALIIYSSTLHIFISVGNEFLTLISGLSF